MVNLSEHFIIIELRMGKKRPLKNNQMLFEAGNSCPAHTNLAPPGLFPRVFEQNQMALEQFEQ